MTLFMISGVVVHELLGARVLMTCSASLFLSLLHFQSTFLHLLEVRFRIRIIWWRLLACM